MAESPIAIKVDSVGKVFKLPHERHQSIKGTLINFSKRGYEEQEVLKDINFEIQKGEFFGIIGRNGSGKSTLLKMLAGIYTPSSGAIQVNGKLTPFIELGVGFNPELTGRENVYLNGALLGFDRKQMDAMYEDIVSFAELEKFMDQKLKNYSSGMQVRLAFSIAIQAKSDILLIDEVLAVGDLNFQEKCFDVFRRMKKEGRTVVFVSHDLASLQEFCTRAVLIDQGLQRNIGDVETIIVEYQERMAQTEETAKAKDPDQASRPGSGECRITNAILYSENKTAVSVGEGQAFHIKINYELVGKVEGLVCGLSIEDPDGVSIIGPNTKEAKFTITSQDIKSATCIEAEFSNNILAPGTYRVTIGLFDKSGTKPFDFYSNALTFKVIGKVRHGKTTIEPQWSLR